MEEEGDLGYSLTHPWGRAAAAPPHSPSHASHPAQGNGSGSGIPPIGVDRHRLQLMGLTPSPPESEEPATGGAAAEGAAVNSSREESYSEPEPTNILSNNLNSSSSSSSSSSSPSHWTCVTCTLINAFHNVSCDVCGTRCPVVEVWLCYCSVCVYMCIVLSGCIQKRQGLKRSNYFEPSVYSNTATKGPSSKRKR